MRIWNYLPISLCRQSLILILLSVLGSVSFETLTDAFGPSSLGIIVVKDLDSEFQRLRAQVLSNASYLAALSNDELGISSPLQSPLNFPTNLTNLRRIPHQSLSQLPRRLVLRQRNPAIRPLRHPEGLLLRQLRLLPEPRPRGRPGRRLPRSAWLHSAQHLAAGGPSAFLPEKSRGAMHAYY